MRKGIIKSQLMGEKSYLSGAYRKINFIWRLFATSLGFSLFGSGGLLLCITLFPIILLFTRDKEKRVQRVRSVIRYTFKFYLLVLEFLGLLRIEAVGLNSLQAMKGNLVIC